MVPSFKANGLEPPDIKTWLSGSKASLASKEASEGILSGSLSNDTTFQKFNDMLISARDRADKIAVFGTKMLNKSLMAQYGLNKLFTSHIPYVNEWVKANDKSSQNFVRKVKNSFQDDLNAQNYLIATHPREGFLSSAPRWAGEQIVMGPFYEAAASGINALRVATTAGRIATGGASGPATKGIQNLTKTFATSKVGQFVANRIIQASEGYLASTSSGDTSKEARSTGVGFATIGAAPEFIPSAIKRWTANILAMGGKPLAQELASAAVAEKTFKGYGAENYPLGTPLPKTELGYVTIGARNAHMLGDVSVAPDTSSPNAGHLVWEGKVFPYANKEQMQDQYSFIERQVEQRRKVEDPVLHKMLDAEKHTMEAIAMRHFGTPLRNMNAETISKVMQRRMELIQEAEEELPVHVPDLNLMTNQEEIAKDFQEHPIAGQIAAQLKQQFPDINLEEVVNNEQVQAIERQTGITSSKNVLKKIGKATKKEKEITSGFASLSAGDITRNRDSSIAYFKNPFKDRLASDGTKIGARDKRSWNERLKAENTERFIQTLKEADGDFIRFENPYHRMLYHYANRDNLSKPIRDRLLRELKKQSEKQGRSLKATDFQKEADWAMVHLNMLAQSGRLTSEGNIFNSTKTGGPENWTKWQAQLQTEVDSQEMNMLLKITKRHPGGQKALESGMKMLQAVRFEAKDPSQWLEYNQAVQDYITASVKQTFNRGAK